MKSLIPYYLTYSHLDSIISSFRDIDTINIFIDLKNISQTLYSKECAYFIVESSKCSRNIDTTFFSSIVSFLGFNKLYAIDRKLNVVFYIFFESGESFYHLNIDRNYKKNRHIDRINFEIEADRELFHDTIRRNLILTEKALNLCPNVYVINLRNFEADFIPYYLIKNKLINNDKSVNLIYSNDHDLYQTLLLGDNIVQYSKSRKSRRIVRRHDIIRIFMDRECNLDSELYPVLIAIIGDDNDCVEGIKYVGKVNGSKVVSEIVELCGGLDRLYDNVVNDSPLFDIEDHDNKVISKIIREERENRRLSRNLKLMSFEVISRLLDRPTHVENIRNIREYIYTILRKERVTECNILRKSLEMNTVSIETDDLELLFS